MKSRWARTLLMLAILAAVGWYVWTARGPLAHQLGNFDLRYAVPMLAVPVAMLAINGLIGRDLAAEFGVQLSAGEWYSLATVNALGNYLPLPQAGALARGVYLKRIHHLPYSAYAATVIVTYVSALVLTGVFGLLGLAILALQGRPAPWLLWAVFAALTTMVLLFTPLIGLIPLPKKLAGFAQGLRTLRQHHVLRRIVILQVALIALTATGFYLACHAQPGGEEVSWPIALMLGLMVSASGVINVTPGNIGVEQGAAELTGRLLHLHADIGFSASALFRAMAVVVVLVLGPICSAWLTRQTPRLAADANTATP